MSRVTIRTSQTVNQLDGELYSGFLDNVHSFLDSYFAVRHVTLSLGDNPESESKKESTDPADCVSFSFSGGDWLTIANTSSECLKVKFLNPGVFGITETVVKGGCSATLRVDESIEAIDFCDQPGRDTPQLITVEPPIESKDD